MADTKLSALAAATTLTDADVMAIVNGGVTTKVTLNQLTSYFESRGRQNNASVAALSPTGGTDTYLVGSDVLIPAGRLQAKSMYRLKFDIAKTTAAGAASMVVTVRLGVNGSTADTVATCPLTFAVQTAVADEGFVDVNCIFRTVGAGTAAVVQAHGSLDHRLAATGLTNVNTSIQRATSAGFNSTLAGLKIGASINTGTSTVANIQLVQAELFNLA